MKSRSPLPSTSLAPKTIRNWPARQLRPAPKLSAKPQPASKPSPPCSPTAATPLETGHAGPRREARTHRRANRACIRTGREVSQSTLTAHRGRREADRAHAALYFPTGPTNPKQLAIRKEVVMHEKHPHNPENENEPNQQEHPSHEAERQPSPRIYVASAADCDNGVLHGAWIDAARETPEIQADIDTMLAQSPQPGAKEYTVFDYDQFGPCRIYEHTSIDLVARIARGIKEHGYAFAAWANVHDDDPGQDDRQRWDDFNDAYLGHYDSVQDYVERLIDDLGYTEQL